jgi:PTS system cellobiose-specific IIA component
MDDTIPQAAMQIILHAGDARAAIRKALIALESAQYDEAEALLAEAKKELAEAHRAQTDIVQGEARGISQDYSVLFTHAQDTLMTVMSESGLAHHLIRLFKGLNDRIDAVEARA